MTGSLPAVRFAPRARASVRRLQERTGVGCRTHSLELARTTVDLAGSDEIQTAHLAEAIQYRLRWQA